MTINKQTKQLCQDHKTKIALPQAYVTEIDFD
jgi:hypothetical protein